MYAFTQDVPATEAMYERIRPRLGDQPPEGLVMHLAVKTATGLRYIDVWNSEADWGRFHDGRVEPAVTAVLAESGVEMDRSQVRFEPQDIVDVWLGAELADSVR